MKPVLMCTYKIIKKNLMFLFASVVFFNFLFVSQQVPKLKKNPHFQNIISLEEYLSLDPHPSYILWTY